jgi:glycerol kinase
MSKFILSIDQGTTSTRCILFDQDGKPVASDQKEHRQIYPQPGWVEHDPVEIWSNTLDVLRGSLRKANLSPSEIACIGITNQRETTLLWNRLTGKPYGNAVVWQDTRTAGICSRLAEDGGQDRFRSKTGLPLATYFSGPKISWLMDHSPDILSDIREGKVLFGTMDTWLLWNMTGGKEGGTHVTDVTNASRTMLMNLETLSWDHEILELLQIPEDILPEIRSSSEIFGYAQIDGFQVPISGILGDQQAALFGQACYDAGEAKNTYGTGCFMLLNTGTQIIHSENGLLTTLGYKIGNSPAIYCLEGSIAITGALVQWLRDNLKIISKSSEVEKLAASVVDNGGVYFVPAFSGLFAPYWRSDARGIIIGLTRYVTNAHLARAALESTAYQTREVVEAMQMDSGIQLTSLKVDGGMVVNELLMQFQADILNVPVVRPSLRETTALGAAYAAGLAKGVWKSMDELKSNWHPDKTWNPQMAQEKRERLFSCWKNAVTRTFDWAKDES